MGQGGSRADGAQEGGDGQADAGGYESDHGGIVPSEVRKAGRAREGQMWPFFQKSGCFISQKYRESPLGVAKGTEIWSLASQKTAIPQKRTT